MSESIEIAVAILMALTTIVEIVVRKKPTAKNWSIVENVLHLVSELLNKAVPNHYEDKQIGTKGMFKATANAIDETTSESRAVTRRERRKQGLKKVVSSTSNVLGIFGKFIK